MFSTKSLILVLGMVVLQTEANLTLPVNYKAINKRPTRTDIYFAGFFPMTAKSGAPEGEIGRGVMPAVNLAIKHINQSPSILHGYKLHMYWNDTEVGEFIRSSFIYQQMAFFKPQKNNKHNYCVKPRKNGHFCLLFACQSGFGVFEEATVNLASFTDRQKPR